MTVVDRPDNGQDELVWVQLPADDVAFLRGFDPDRDRTASRADMVRVIEHLQDALAYVAGAGEQQREWVPEDGDSRCQQCGRLNPVWWAPSRLWNHVVGGDPNHEAGGVLCPTCFATKAAELLALLGGPQPDEEAVELAAQIVENAMGIGSVSDEQLAQVAESIRQIPSYLARADREASDRGPQCPSSSHGTDGWRCEHRAGHDGGHRNGEVEWP